MKKLFLIAFSQIIYIGIATGQGTPPKAVLSDIPTQESMNAWRAKEAEIRQRLDKICTFFPIVKNHHLGGFIFIYWLIYKVLKPFRNSN
jgi:nitrate reductase NapE component